MGKVVFFFLTLSLVLFVSSTSVFCQNGKDLHEVVRRAYLANYSTVDEFQCTIAVSFSNKQESEPIQRQVKLWVKQDRLKARLFDSNSKLVEVMAFDSKIWRKYDPERGFLYEVLHDGLPNMLPFDIRRFGVDHMGRSPIELINGIDVTSLKIVDSEDRSRIVGKGNLSKVGPFFIEFDSEVGFLPSKVVYKDDSKYSREFHADYQAIGEGFLLKQGTVNYMEDGQQSQAVVLTCTIDNFDPKPLAFFSNIDAAPGTTVLRLVDQRKSTNVTDSSPDDSDSSKTPAYSFLVLLGSLLVILVTLRVFLVRRVK